MIEILPLIILALVSWRIYYLERQVSFGRKVTCALLRHTYGDDPEAVVSGLFNSMKKAQEAYDKENNKNA